VRLVGAAELVHPETAERLRTWHIEQFRSPQTAPERVQETRFATPWEIAGIQDRLAVESVSARDLVARFAAGMGPEAFARRLRTVSQDGGSASTVPTIRVERRLIACTLLECEYAKAEYRADWYFGGQLNKSLGGVAGLSLARSGSRWYVVDADLSGLGTGHISPPSLEEMQRSR
jgi:hypothetical protein